MLLSHRSVRGYRPDTLPAGTLESLIAAAQSAATSSNLQTWSVIAVTDPDKKTALSKVAAGQKHIRECPLFLVWLDRHLPQPATGRKEGVALETMPYQETFLVAAIDAALAAQNAALRRNRWDCPCVYIGALRNNPMEVGRSFRPAAGGVWCVRHVRRLCLATAANAVKPRLPQDVVLHHEVYDARGGGAWCGL